MAEDKKSKYNLIKSNKFMQIDPDRWLNIYV